jgi:hypothetical protein
LFSLDTLYYIHILLQCNTNIATWQILVYVYNRDMNEITYTAIANELEREVSSVKRLMERHECPKTLDGFLSYVEWYERHHLSEIAKLRTAHANLVEKERKRRMVEQFAKQL